MERTLRISDRKILIWGTLRQREREREREKGTGNPGCVKR